MKALILTLSLPLIGLWAQAQGSDGLWSLQECIDYALRHNITVQQRDIAAQQAEIELNTARSDRLPSVSASASQNYSFGRGLSADNTYVNTNTASTSFSLGASMDLFSGFRTSETIRLRSLDLDAALADLSKARNDISMNVASAYVQILYDLEIRDVALRQVSIDSMQVERLRAMLDNGKASSVELSQQKATLEQSRYTLTQAENSLSLDVLALTQLLELPSPEGFRVVRPDSDSDLGLIENPDAIYADAAGSRPEILAEQHRLDSYDAQLKIARSSALPSLSLSGGLGSNYYNSSGYAIGSFNEQIKNNFSQYIGLSLNVPIFSKFANRNSVRTTALARCAQALTLQNAKNSLYKEIQQAYFNAVAAQGKFLSAAQAAEAATESFELVTVKYESGKASITEFNEAKNSALKSESDFVQARYELMYQKKLLDFYKGIDF